MIRSTTLAIASLAAAAGAAHAQPGRSEPAPLAGQYSGAVTTISHPRGWFTIEVPQGWSVASEQDGSMVINPGLTSSDTLDALIVIAYGALEPSQQGRDAAALFPEVRAALVQQLAAQSIVVADATAPARSVRLAHATGVVQEWPGRAAGRDVRVMFGALVKDDTYLAVTAVAVAGTEDRYLPGVKRLLHSVVPRPPQRNTAAEAALVGAVFAATETRPGGSRGSFSTTLTFVAGQRVRKTMILSGLTGLSTSVGGESEEWGAYEVVGDEITLSFKDSTDTLRLVVDRGTIAALERDGRRYTRR